MVLLTVPGLSLAQSEEDEQREENTLESVLTNSDDADDVFEPVDLGQASEDDLMSIPGMSSKCASAIIAYRKKNGPIGSLSEISHVDGMTAAILSSLQRHMLIRRKDDFHANLVSYFRISPQRLPLFEDACGDYGILNFQKFGLSYRNFELSAITDKDPGEQRLADFYSLSLMARNVAGLISVELGDYTLSLGNGLLFSRGGMISKSAGAITPLFSTRAYALKPYRSRGENKFLRGAAVAVQLRNVTITGFGSWKRLDARTDSAGTVKSVDYSGLHLPGQPPRSGLQERIGGAVIGYESSTVYCGMSAVSFYYDHAFKDYYLKEVTALESFARLRLDNLAFSGEVLVDKSVSFNSNLNFDRGDARFALGVRSLHSRILQNYSGSLSESFPTNPEEGIYFGATLRPVDIVKLGFYYDRFRIFPASGDPERSGEEVFADAYVSLSRKKIFEGSGTVVYFRYKYKTKEDSYVPIADFPSALSVISGSKQAVRCDFRHRFASPFSIRLRVEKNFISSGENGELVLLDAGWRMRKGAVDARLCFYRTDSYKSAFYTVEKNLPRVAGFTVLYGDGARFFLIGSWTPLDSFTVGIKVSRDIYSRNREISVESFSRDLAGSTDIGVEFGYVLK